MAKTLLSRLDMPLVVATTLLVLVGLLNLYSATYQLPVAKYFKTQLIWTAVGLALMVATMIIDYNYLERLSFVLYALLVIALVILIVFGKPIAGSARWFRIGPISIQPSEMMKIVTLMVLAKVFRNFKSSPPYDLLQLLGPLCLLGIPMVLINLQPDLGTTLTIGLSGVSVMLFVGIKRRTLVGLTVFFMALVPVGLVFRPFSLSKRTCLNLFAARKVCAARRLSSYSKQNCSRFRFTYWQGFSQWHAK